MTSAANNSSGSPAAENSSRPPAAENSTDVTTPSAGPPSEVADSGSGRGLARILAGVGLVFLTIHFTATLIYLNPVSIVGLVWRQPVVSYLEPLFRQRWSLFAPEPPLLDRRLDYQCDVDGEISEWVSRSDDLLDTHARTRFGPAGPLRRLETAAVVATVGSQDEVLSELVNAQDQASDAQRDQIEDLLAQRAASSIRSSEVGYRLILSYCRQDLGRDPDYLRYRIVTTNITPFSLRNDESHVEEPKAMVLPWLSPAQFDELEQRAIEYMQIYQQQKQERAQAAETTPAAPVGENHE